MNMFLTLLPLLIWLALIIGIIYIIIKAIKTSTSRRDQYLEQIQMQLVHLQPEVETLKNIIEKKEFENSGEE